MHAFPKAKKKKGVEYWRHDLVHVEENRAKGKVMSVWLSLDYTTLSFYIKEISSREEDTWAYDRVPVVEAERCCTRLAEFIGEKYDLPEATTEKQQAWMSLNFRRKSGLYKSWAASGLGDAFKKARKEMDPLDLQIQKACFAEFGKVWRYATCRRAMRDRFREIVGEKRDYHMVGTIERIKTAPGWSEIEPFVEVMTEERTVQGDAWVSNPLELNVEPWNDNRGGFLATEGSHMTVVTLKLKSAVESLGLQEDYIASDYVRYRWVRYAMNEGAALLHPDSSHIVTPVCGRVRKALANVPGHMQSEVGGALRVIRFMGDVPRRRLTWIAATFPHNEMKRAGLCGEPFQDGKIMLAEAVRKGTDYDHRRAKQIYKEATGFSKRICKISEVKQFLQWLWDGRGQSCADTPLRTWARRSARYHRDLRNRRREEMLETIEEQHPGHHNVTLPSLRIPESMCDSLRTIQTIEGLVAEAHEMQHCVDNYWTDVIRGHSIILGYKDGDKRLTLEVRNGDVAQCVARGNLRNSFAERVEQVVSRYVRSEAGKEAIERYRQDLKESVKEVELPKRRNLPF